MAPILKRRGKVFIVLVFHRVWVKYVDYTLKPKAKSHVTIVVSDVTRVSEPE